MPWSLHHAQFGIWFYWHFLSRFENTFCYMKLRDESVKPWSNTVLLRNVNEGISCLPVVCARVMAPRLPLRPGAHCTLGNYGGLTSDHFWSL